MYRNPSVSKDCVASRCDWWFSNSALRGWKDSFGNGSPFRTMSGCGSLLVLLQAFRLCPFVSACSAIVSSNSEKH